MDKIKLSVAIPICNEEENINEVYYKTSIVLYSLNLPFEIIFIDDGGQDKTYEILKGIQIKDGHIKVIKLVKNYGQLIALLAGFEFTKGEIVIVMDGDLQYDPKDIPRFLQKIEEGFGVVSGWRHKRQDPILRRLISKFANWIMGMKTGVRLHDYGCAFTAIRKELVDRLKYYGRDARFIKPLLVCLAGSVAEVKISHHPRKAGSSKYNLVKIIKLGLDFLFNFSLERKVRDNLPYVIEEVIGA